MRIIRRKAKQLAQLKEDFPDVLNRVLNNRGIHSIDELSTQTKDLSHYNSLSQIDKAAQIIGQALIANKKIMIVGDFDADGATSTALCLLALKAMGCKQVDYIVPNRFDFGYGLTSPVVDVANEAGAQLLITVDNGISSIDGVAYAKEQGMQVVVTDHHLPPEQLPNADAIVNPNQYDCNFPSKHLAGVGVAFYTMSALKHYLSTQGYFERHCIEAPNMASFLDLVAIGTVADLVCLDKNNRILVHQGIQRIRSGKTRPGVIALLNTVKKSHRHCCTSDIAFYIGPRLNAAGRLQDMACGIECLLTEDNNKAAVLAAELHGLNQSRKEIEQSMRDDADTLMSQIMQDLSDVPPAIVLYKDDFHQGVVGILAGRLKEQYYRPSLVFTDDGQNNNQQTILKGSARSIAGVHIRDTLARVESLSPGIIIKFGGHAMAAGLSIYAHDLPKFTTLFTEVVSQISQDLPSTASIISDGELEAPQLNIETANTLKFAFPWGQAFEEPVFDGVFDIVNQRIVGQKHLKLTLSKSGIYIDAIAFSVDVAQWPNHLATQVEITYKLDINDYQGKQSPQLLVSSIQAKES